MKFSWIPWFRTFRNFIFTNDQFLNHFFWPILNHMIIFPFNVLVYLQITCFYAVTMLSFWMDTRQYFQVKKFKLWRHIAKECVEGYHMSGTIVTYHMFMTTNSFVNKLPLRYITNLLTKLHTHRKYPSKTTNGHCSHMAAYGTILKLSLALLSIVSCDSWQDVVILKWTHTRGPVTGITGSLPDNYTMLNHTCMSFTDFTRVRHNFNP